MNCLLADSTNSYSRELPLLRRVYRALFVERQDENVATRFAPGSTSSFGRGSYGLSRFCFAKQPVRIRTRKTHSSCVEFISRELPLLRRCQHDFVCRKRERFRTRQVLRLFWRVRSEAFRTVYLGLVLSDRQYEFVRARDAAAALILSRFFSRQTVRIGIRKRCRCCADFMAILFVDVRTREVSCCFQYLVRRRFVRFIWILICDTDSTCSYSQDIPLFIMIFVCMTDSTNSYSRE